MYDIDCFGNIALTNSMDSCNISTQRVIPLL